ncbi:hypothetical protein V8C44DRAFT_165240 [Trichoderma aethiopicum]
MRSSTRIVSYCRKGKAHTGRRRPFELRRPSSCSHFFPLTFCLTCSFISNPLLVSSGFAFLNPFFCFIICFFFLFVCSVCLLLSQCTLPVRKADKPVF